MSGLRTPSTTLPAAGFQYGERDHFDRLAQQTGDIWWGSRTRAGKRRLVRRAEMLAAELARLDDPLVLELGCGTGAFTKPLLQRMPHLRLTAVDISPHSVGVARRQCASHPRARFEVVDLLDAPYAPASFDALVGNSVLHHLHVELFLPVIERLLRPGGIVWFYEPNMLNPQIAVEKNVRFIGRWLQNTPDETAFFRRGLARRLAAAGFAEVSVVPFDFLHPATPALVAPLVDRITRSIERLPLVREFAGSLRVRAVKPTEQ